MADLKITYEVLFDILRREKTNNELQDVEETFYEDVDEYVEKKMKSLANSMDSEYSSYAEREKAKTQMQNIRRTVKEIYGLRERKILGLAMNKARTESGLIDTTRILMDERPLFDKAVKVLREHRNEVLDPMLETKKKRKQRKDGSQNTLTETKKVQVRIDTDLPKFLGTDKKVYGPYTEGEMVSLPEGVAKLLMKKGRASQEE